MVQAQIDAKRMLMFYHEIHSIVSNTDGTLSNSFELILEKVKLSLLKLVCETLEQTQRGKTSSSSTRSQNCDASYCNNSYDDAENDHSLRACLPIGDSQLYITQFNLNRIYESTSLYDLLDPSDAKTCRHILVSCIEKSNVKCLAQSSFYYFLSLDRRTTTITTTNTFNTHIFDPLHPQFSRSPSPSRQTLIKSR
jgi:hypothetical protein